MGETKIDFVVQPYIRIRDLVIEKNGTKVVATFKIQQTVLNNVVKIGLYAHPDPSVGEPMRTVATEQNINAVTDANTIYTLEIDLISNSANLEPGNQYFFRVGALIDAGISRKLGVINRSYAMFKNFATKTPRH